MILIATLKGHTYFSEIYIPNLINKKKIGVELTDGVKKNIRFTKLLFFFCRFSFWFWPFLDICKHVFKAYSISRFFFSFSVEF
jgi:hypothetical protein